MSRFVLEDRPNGPKKVSGRDKPMANVVAHQAGMTRTQGTGPTD
jgi:hypothetical protein